MRRYDDPVDVRRGPVPGGGAEGPEQFLWRGRLWKVRAVVAHWVEATPWWQGSGAAALAAGDVPAPGAGATDLLAEREVWRVEAGRGALLGSPGGVFDLSFDAGAGRWQLVGCVD
ncbi:DUF6504 family protein [Nocardioides solisilvae]|uniref:DUF6504 family protein n=1 Tax=Nocardioides solisilvae TaxID=1542435 RepID=UPI000D746D64|nr:DUF6504 family protein [Nocardioides solisilvae]